MPRLPVKVSQGDEDGDDFDRTSLLPPARRWGNEGHTSEQQESWQHPPFHHNDDTAYPSWSDDLNRRHHNFVDSDDELPVAASQIEAWKRQRAEVSGPASKHVSTADQSDDASFASLASLSVLPSRYNTLEDDEASLVRHSHMSSGGPSGPHALTNIPEDAEPSEASDPRDIVFGSGSKSGDRLAEDLAERLHAEQLIAKDEGTKASSHGSKQKLRPLKVLFLSSEADGQCRASSTVLLEEFQKQYPGSTCSVLDVWESDGKAPQNSNKEPGAQSWLQSISQAKPVAILADQYSTWTSEGRIRRRIDSYDPDVVVSVHPTMNSVPFLATENIRKARGKHIPFFTVVTALGSAPCSWFQPNVDKVFVASDGIRRQAKRCGNVPDENIVVSGMPISADFEKHVESMGDRTAHKGKQYRHAIRKQIGLDTTKPMVLVMADGADAVDLSTAVHEMCIKLTSQKLKATICVICGQNDKLRRELAATDWDAAAKIERAATPNNQSFFNCCKSAEQTVVKSAPSFDEGPTKRAVDVTAFGSVKQLADYMIAADALVTNAADAETIFKSAAVGLPVLLTGSLSGQDTSNVDFVIASGCGWYAKSPITAAKEVATWLEKTSVLETMSRAAHRAANPHAAADIVLDIGMITQTWMRLNEHTPDTSANSEVGA